MSSCRPVIPRRTLLRLGGTAPLVLAATFAGARPAEAAATSIALGAFVPGAAADGRRLDRFARLVGRMPAVVLWYQAWGGSYRNFDPAAMNVTRARGAMPLVTWEPWVPGAGTQQSAYSLQAILDGDHTTYIRAWAQAARNWGQPLLLRWAHEMNGTWYPWAAGVQGNTAGQYVDAWRLLVGIFREERAYNVGWVWSPNVAYPGSTSIDAVFPGDDFLDWCGIDGYNWGVAGPGEANPGSRWQTLAEVFGPSYAEITALSARPIMLSETASAEAGGAKADWIRTGFGTTIPNLPRVRAVVWFNERKERDWRVDSSRTALNAYRAIVADARYSGTV